MLSNLSVVTQLLSLDFNLGESHTRDDTWSHYTKTAYDGGKSHDYSAKRQHTEPLCLPPPRIM